MTTPSSSALRAVDHVLAHCGSLAPGERCVVPCDPSTRPLAELFVARARLLTDAVELAPMPALARHGEDPPPDVAARMARADLIACLTAFSLAHSQARIDAGRAGARFLSLPLYTWALLESPALTADYRALTPVVRRFADAFTAGAEVRVTTAAGTDVTLDARGRVGNCCPGWVARPGDLGSPPDIEANVSPVEDASHGVVVVDGSITCPEIGLLTEPMRLHVEGGRVRAIEGGRAEHRAFLERTFEGPESKRRVLAECGVGLNPLAELTGTMLTDEGAAGCIHFGFGSNYTVGGRNKVDFHLDFVFRDASLSVDGRPLLAHGELQP